MQVANRESFAVASRRRLPYDAEVTYLESTGTQWIDTGVIAADNVGVQMDVVGGIVPSGAPPTTMLFGVFGSDSRYGLGYNSRFFAWWNTIFPGGNFSGAYSGMFSLNYNNSRTFACGTYYSGSLSGTYNASNTQIRLLNALRMDTGQNAFADCASCRFGAVRITQGMTLVRDLIPVRKGGVGYMYDRVSGRLFGNMGTGSFVLGADLPYDSKVEWLASTTAGKEWVNTRFIPSSVTDVLTVDAAYTNAGNVFGCLFGVASRVNGNQRFYQINKTTTSNQFRLITSTGDVFWTKTPEFSGARHRYVLNKNILYIDGTQTVTGSGTSAESANLYLFARNNAITASIDTYGAAWRIYSAKLERSGVMQFDLQPVRVGSVGYFYDRISGTLLPSGGDPLVVGPDIN